VSFDADEPVRATIYYGLSCHTLDQTAGTATYDTTSVIALTGLQDGTTYYFAVAAADLAGNSTYDDNDGQCYSFTTVDLLNLSAYDMLNGESGMYTYFDDLYDGDGDRTQPLSPLSDGLGELTDGVIATQNWNQTSGPYVGWVSVDPTITCHFEQWTTLRTVVLHVDDSNGSGGVYPPDDVTLSMGGTTLVFTITDPPGGEPFAIELDDLDLAGDTLEVTLADHSTGGYMMLSELEFYGSQCLGDLDSDGTIGLGDLAILLANYPTAGGALYEEGDLDADGDIDLADLAILLSVYGTDCP
jgi:hypothetical protein